MTLFQALQEVITRTKNGFFDKNDTYLMIILNKKGLIRVQRTGSGMLSMNLIDDYCELTLFIHAGYVFITK